MKQNYLLKLLIFFMAICSWQIEAQTYNSSNWSASENIDISKNAVDYLSKSSNVIRANYKIAAARNIFYVRSNTGNPWGQTTNQESMDLAFGGGNWTEEFFETLDPLVIFDPSVRFVFMDGSENGPSAMNAFLLANLPAMEAWVNDGGSLFMNAAPNSGSNMNFGFGGSTLVYPNFSGSVTIIDTGHPAF